MTFRRLTYPIRRFIRPLAARLAVLIVKLPVIRQTPGSLRRLVEWDAVHRARLARRAKDPDRAVALLEAVATSGAGARIWHQLALARFDQKDLEASLAAARRARDAGSVEAKTYLLLAQLASRAEEHEEAAASLKSLTEAHFSDVDDVGTALLPLADADLLGAAAALVDRVERGEFGPIPDGWLDSARALLSLLDAERSGDRELSLTLERLKAGSADEVSAVLQWALARRDYSLAAAVAHRVPTSRLPVRSVQRAAQAARSTGQLRAGTQLAERLVATGMADPSSETLASVGRHEVDLLDHGWHTAERTTPSYQPDERTVFYLLHNSLPYASAGYATRTHGLLTGLARLDWSMHGVTRLGYPYDRWPKTDDRTVRAVDIVDDIPYHRLITSARTYPKTPFRQYANAYTKRVVALAMEHRPAVIHAASNYYNGIVAIETGRQLGLPSVYEVRGLWEVTRGSRQPDYVSSDGYQLSSRLEAEACQLADRAIAITGALKDQMVARGVPDEHVMVLPNGVDTDRFLPMARDDDLARALLIEDKVVIGYVGSIVDYEGLDLLLEAIARLKTSRDDFHLLVVGDGDAYEQCLALRDELGLQSITTFTGRVPHEQVAKYYSLIDIAPFPRKPLPVCEMVSPLKPFEAMSAEVVPVVSSCQALTEIVNNGQTGLIFKKGDSNHLTAVLARLLDDEAMRRSLGLAARAWVKRERDWSSLTRRLGDLYHDLSAARRQPQWAWSGTSTRDTDAGSLRD